MKIGQVGLPSGEIRAVLISGDDVYDVGGQRSRSLLSYVREAAERGVPLAELLSGVLRSGPDYSAAELARASSPDRPRFAIPISPPEVWGAGVTYKRSAEFRDDDAQATSKGIYDQVYSGARPEVFFKGTASRCVGPNEAIGVRSDSSFTAPEPELALVLDHRGAIVGYTLANDVSAWDIERQNPLFLPLSKVYGRCCAIGPVIVTPDELRDPLDLPMTCRILRGGDVIFSGEANTSQMKRSFGELIHHLTLDNPIPDGTVLCTGTGIIVRPEHALAEGDVVEIEVAEIGMLRNPVVRLPGR